MMNLLWISETDLEFLNKLLIVVIPIFIIGGIIMFFSKKMGDSRLKGKNIVEAKVTKVVEKHERDEDNYVKRLNYEVTVEYRFKDKNVKMVLDSEKYLAVGDKLLIKHYEDKDPYIVSYLIDNKYDIEPIKMQMPWYYLGGIFICGGFLIIIFNIIDYFENNISYIEDIIVIILWILIEIFILRKYLKFKKKLNKINNGEYERVKVNIIDYINLSTKVNGNYVEKYNAIVEYEKRKIRVPINIVPDEDNEIYFYSNKETKKYLLDSYPNSAKTFKNGLLGIMIAIFVVIIITVIKIFI